ncbi:uncharacterized protein LOC110850215 [Folsomia candida]|uniref:uncharacterized protein LOC110850215 n=1 Tax=Folsomia candida TaxID=158441 RepID=UPI000B8FB27F|nr:uncharacterized protein LOC110850215 [Folsomia candida]
MAANYSIIITVLAFLSITISAEMDISHKVILTAQQSGMDLVGQIGTKLFFITGLNATKVNWMDGNATCGRAGLKFATFKSEEEYRFLRDTLWNVVEPSRGDSDPWVGGSVKGLVTGDQVSCRESFEWEDGSEIASFNLMNHPRNWLCLFVKLSDDVVYTDFCISTQRDVVCQFDFN